mmetsp:Transcript_15927/g.23424  ORF Transcript_15927/g.23424 Transcript_15927/m.23424 type:complete len:81 (+) Transcript_15927:99-341(+)
MYECWLFGALVCSWVRQCGQALLSEVRLILSLLTKRIGSAFYAVNVPVCPLLQVSWLSTVRLQIPQTMCFCWLPQCPFDG